MKIKVKVKKEHINKGKRGVCQLCPIALALKDMGYKYVVVSGLAIDFYHGNNQYFVSNTNKVVNFITTFDREGKNAVKPVEFTLIAK